MDRSRVQKHFDALAETYDRGKTHAWYYYRVLKSIAAAHVPLGRVVLEVGCGTGDLLVAVKPKYGVGIDISTRMIELAKDKYRAEPYVHFKESSLGAYQPEIAFDYVLFFDVIEHLENQKEDLMHLGAIMRSGTTLLASMANPLWEPILMLLEKFHLKMPEGPHHRIPRKEFLALLGASGFSLVHEGRKLLIPAYIPWFSPAINRFAERLPLLRELCMVQYFICKKR